MGSQGSASAPFDVAADQGDRPVRGILERPQHEIGASLSNGFQLASLREAMAIRPAKPAKRKNWISVMRASWRCQICVAAVVGGC
jgi:hypothetical protein